MTRAVIVAVAIGALACDRETREFRETPPGAMPERVALTPLRPGPSVPTITVSGPYSENAYAISEGQRLYTWFNCVGCHANGGGGSGPPLMDDEWIYGSEPAQVFATIVEGRPRGMPAFGERVPANDVWRLVAYVRSLSGLTRKDARPGRTDDMQVTAPPSLLPPGRPVQSGVPPQDHE
jgi:cytochrome c oxidase cbb3-type subunit 3